MEECERYGDMKDVSAQIADPGGAGLGHVFQDAAIEYYKTGDLKTWDEYNIAWV